MNRGLTDKELEDLESALRRLVTMLGETTQRLKRIREELDRIHARVDALRVECKAECEAATARITAMSARGGKSTSQNAVN